MMLTKMAVEQEGEPRLSTTVKVLSVLLVLAMLGLLIVIGAMTQGCTSTGSQIDWNRVIQAIQEYQDDIPYDKIKDALEKLQ